MVHGSLEGPFLLSTFVCSVVLLSPLRFLGERLLFSLLFFCVPFLLFLCFRLLSCFALPVVFAFSFLHKYFFPFSFLVSVVAGRDASNAASVIWPSLISVSFDVGE